MIDLYTDVAVYASGDWHTDYLEDSIYTGLLNNTSGIPLFDDPNELPRTYRFGTFSSPYPNTGTPSESGRVYSYEVWTLDYFVPSNSPIVNFVSHLNGARVYYVRGHFDLSPGTPSGVPVDYGLFYAGYQVYSVDDEAYYNYLYKLLPSDLELIDPVAPDSNYAPTFNGSNWFEFLASFGKTLLNDNWLLDLLTVDIGGYNIMALMFGAGFIIYMGWSIVKWAIP